MNVLFGDVATLYHHTPDGWVRTVLRGVQWHMKAERITDGKGVLTISELCTVTVPARCCPNGLAIGVDGLDVILPGAADAEVGNGYTLKELRRDYPALRVIRSLTDNTMRPRLKHWRIAAT